MISSIFLRDLKELSTKSHFQISFLESELNRYGCLQSVCVCDLSAILWIRAVCVCSVYAFFENAGVCVCWVSALFSNGLVCVCDVSALRNYTYVRVCSVSALKKYCCRCMPHTVCACDVSCMCLRFRKHLISALIIKHMVVENIRPYIMQIQKFWPNIWFLYLDLVFVRDWFVKVRLKHVARKDVTYADVDAIKTGLFHFHN